MLVTLHAALGSMLFKWSGRPDIDKLWHKYHYLNAMSFTAYL